MGEKDREEGSASGSQRETFPELPSFPPGDSNPFRLPEHAPTEVQCECCGVRDPRVRSYYVIYFVLWRPVYPTDDDEALVYCPSCMRSYLLWRFPFALVGATIFAPVIFVSWTFLFLRTFFR